MVFVKILSEGKEGRKISILRSACKHIALKKILHFQFCILVKLDVMKKRDAFVLAGFKRNNLADYGEPASLEEPEIVITIGMQNLPELWGTCQS